MGGMGGGMGAGMGAGMAGGGGMPGGAPGGDPSAAGGGQRGGRMMAFAGGAGAPGGGGAASGMSDADRAKMREAMQAALKGRSMQDLTAEERTKIMQEVMAKMGRTPGAGRTAAAKPDPSKPETAQAGGAPGAEDQGRRRRGEGGGAGGPGGAGGGFPGMGGGGGLGRFTEADLKNAKLPPPPDQDSNLDVLLRPGLLADVEIIVEKIPNAIHIPAQAVFEKEGKLVVYVKEGEKFVARPIKLAKRSESTLVVADGLKPGETIAMANPEAKPGTKQKSDDKGGSGGPMNALPGGKS
jgi:hypothetical protein